MSISGSPPTHVSVSIIVISPKYIEGAESTCLYQHLLNVRQLAIQHSILIVRYNMYRLHHSVEVGVGFIQHSILILRYKYV